jgi:hypothetical protein
MTHIDFGVIRSPLQMRLYPSNMPPVRQEFIPPCQALIFISYDRRNDPAFFALFPRVPTFAYPLDRRQVRAVACHRVTLADHLDLNPNEGVSCQGR